uniref:NADH dehydrogenase subunit 2 n=1 Tax=Strongyloides venezuelensis TaxID=75913 RepID=A0A0P0YK55_STRVS|nr:NADH dehydrogenase subunit 2 [Strongyloides venezuelensis]BAT21226.1 NADH dehydrogenase subunit 2 [Strongyloides venezuelensis]
MFYFLCFFYVFIFFLLNSFTCNVVVWWVVFLMMTLVFISINKGSVSSMVNYFMIQEILGFTFLLVSVSWVQLVILLMKVGVAPFHFWVFSVTNGLSGWSVMWFLTMQKLPFIPVIMYLSVSYFVYLVVLGIIFCYFQLFFVKGYKNMLVLASTESFSWLVLMIFFSLSSGLLFGLFYIIFFYFLLDHSGSSELDSYNWETVFIFMNIPFAMTFFVKFFSLISLFSSYTFLLLLVLFVMFLSVFSLGFWLCNMSTDFNFNIFKNRSYWYWFCYPLMFLCLI